MSLRHKFFISFLLASVTALFAGGIFVFERVRVGLTEAALIALFLVFFDYLVAYIISKPLLALASDAEEEMAKNKALLEGIGDGVVATDAAGLVIFMNSVAEEMLQIKAKELVGKDFNEFIKVTDEKGGPIPKEKRPLQATLSSFKKFSTAATFFFVGRDGTSFPASITAAPILIGGVGSGAVVVFRDITKEKEIEKAKDDFISLASHQLRTPLTGIRWVIERFLKKEKISPKGEEYLNDIRSSVAKLSEIIATLLNVSRIEAGIVIVPRPIDVVDFFSSYIEEVRPMAVKKNITLVFEKHPKTLQIVSDEGAIRNVIHNLVSNALEYTPEEGRVEVTLEKDDDAFLFAVRDTGIGIPKAEKPMIFEKFARASNAKLVKPDGTGLGLYIVAQAVKYMGGTIRFESEENKGTVFYVQMPLETKEKKGYKPLATLLLGSDI